LFQQEQQLQISSSSIHYSFIHTADIIRFFSSLFCFPAGDYGIPDWLFDGRAGKTLVVKINDHPFPKIFRFLGNYKRECSGGFGFGIWGDGSCWHLHKSQFRVNPNRVFDRFLQGNQGSYC
jgi:hypothetical protein